MHITRAQSDGLATDPGPDNVESHGVRGALRQREPEPVPEPDQLLGPAVEAPRSRRPATTREMRRRLQHVYEAKS